MGKLTKKRLWLISLSALFLFSAIGIWHSTKSNLSSSDHSQNTAHEHADEQVYVCPMHSQVRESSPGRCPICGMDLVATKDKSSAATPIETHHHTDQILKTAPPPNAQTAPIEKHRLEPHTRAWARVVVDGANETVVTAPADGWVRQLYVNHVGQTVAAGEPLFEIFSPELYQRQRDYIDTLNRRDQLAASITDMRGQNAEVLGSLARERKRQRDAFLRIGIATSSIDTLEQYRRPLDALAVASPYAGKVIAIDARSGLAAGPSTPLYRLVNDNAVQMDVVLTPTQLAALPAAARVVLSEKNNESAIPLDLTQATYDSSLQSYIVRIALPVSVLAETRWANLQHHSIPQGAVLDVDVIAETREVLAVPRKAILESPEGKFVVIETAHQRYAVHKVTVGAQDKNWIEIINGVKQGDVVVTEGQFLLDAAATFQQSFSQQAAE